MLNRIVLIGRLTADPQLRHTQNSGKAVTRFTLAVDRPKKQDGSHDTDFIDVVAWNKLGELCANHLGKGRMVAVEGRLQVRTYDARDGSKRKAAEIVAEQVVFLDRPRAAEETKPAPTGNIEDIEDIESDEEAPF